MTASAAMLDGLRAGLGGDEPLGPAVATRLEAALAAGRAAWPGVDVDPARFAAYLGERLGEERPLEVALDRLALADLYLACAAAAGAPPALAALDRLLSHQVALAATSARAGRTVEDEAAQVVRTLVLLPRPERPPALLDYAGRGPLAGWLRIVATREVVRLARRGGHEVELGDALVDEAAVAEDPMLAALKQRYRDELAEAFRAALAGLAPRDRTLLRFQLVDGLSIDEIGAIQRVHRATAARRLERVRDELALATRAHFAERLALGDDELTSIVRLVQSQLDVSIIRHLGPGDQR